MKGELKVFGYKITLSAIIAFIVTGLFIGILNEIGKDIYQWIKISDYEFINSIFNSVLDVLFRKFEINVLTILIAIAISIPTFRFFNRQVFGRLITETIFYETFQEQVSYWNLNFWGSTNPNKTNRIENGTMVFEASREEWRHKSEGGAYYDLRNGIQKGLNYHVSCKVKSLPGTTMSFRLWLHDTLGNQQVLTNWETPPSDNMKTFELKYIATDSNAIRIHLHCKSGQGQIIVSEVKVIRIGK